jgi:hypothetical protein
MLAGGGRGQCAAVVFLILKTSLKRCSAVLTACATMVREGFTAVDEGKKDASTT